MSNETPDLMDRLAAPFEASEVRWKPQAIAKSGNKALAICYIDARCVMDRLDEVFGVGGWQDSYQPLAEGTMLCRLRALIGEQWIEKTDVGGESEQPDGGDRTKAAVSDALKRAAIKFGIGRYLYRLPHQWVDYDPAKKQFARTPTLPAWALPKHVPEPAKNGKPSEEVKRWTDWLAKRPQLNDLNLALPDDFAKLGEPDKRRVWEAIQDYAESEGWAFAKLQKAFVVKPSEEPIDPH